MTVRRLDNVLEAYEFAPEDIEVAKKLHPLTIAWLRTLRTEAALLKLNLRFDPQKPHEFVQNEAHLMGQIAAITTILGD